MDSEKTSGESPRPIDTLSSKTRKPIPEFNLENEDIAEITEGIHKTRRLRRIPKAKEIKEKSGESTQQRRKEKLYGDQKEKFKEKGKDMKELKKSKAVYSETGLHSRSRRSEELVSRTSSVSNDQVKPVKCARKEKALSVGSEKSIICCEKGICRRSAFKRSDESESETAITKKKALKRRPRELGELKEPGFHVPSSKRSESLKVKGLDIESPENLKDESSKEIWKKSKEELIESDRRIPTPKKSDVHFEDETGRKPVSPEKSEFKRKKREAESPKESDQKTVKPIKSALKHKSSEGEFIEKTSERVEKPSRSEFQLPGETGISKKSELKLKKGKEEPSEEIDGKTGIERKIEVPEETVIPKKSEHKGKKSKEEISEEIGGKPVAARKNEVSEETITSKKSDYKGKKRKEDISEEIDGKPVTPRKIEVPEETASPKKSEQKGKKIKEKASQEINGKSVTPRKMEIQEETVVPKRSEHKGKKRKEEVSEGIEGKPITPRKIEGPEETITPKRSELMRKKGKDEPSKVIDGETKPRSDIRHLEEIITPVKSEPKRKRESEEPKLQLPHYIESDDSDRKRPRSPKKRMEDSETISSKGRKRKDKIKSEVGLPDDSFGRGRPKESYPFGREAETKDYDKPIKRDKRNYKKGKYIDDATGRETVPMKKHVQMQYYRSGESIETIPKAFPINETRSKKAALKKPVKKDSSFSLEQKGVRLEQVSSIGSDEKKADISKAKRGKTTMISEIVFTQILASLVPDEIIYYVQETKYRKYDVCLLFGDASGFTDLCERYSKTGKGGPSRLTVVLNSFIGTMVQEIMTHGGDVLKFSGDAFLAWWRIDENLTDLQDCVTAAIETAMIIQKSFGKYETDVQVTLRVKLAISAGQVAFSSIGTEDTKHYVVLGSPVWDVKLAEYMCVAGDIMVAPKAWALVNSQEYDYEMMPDGQHVKVLGAGAGWRQMQGYSGGGADSGTAEMGATGDEEWESENKWLGSILFMVGDDDDDYDDASDAESVSSLEGPRASGDGQLRKLPRSAKAAGAAQAAAAQDSTASKDETMSLRPSVAYAVKRKMKTVLRPYVIKPVLKGLDMDEPIEYLTEMRQVVIVFTNLVTLNPPMGKMIKLVDECYRIVCSSVHAHQGCVNKVSLFDKDMMFLIIFGLRGFKHELESQIALRCGAELHERLSTVDMVRVTSVGITTGMTYCGVVGHTLRREYSVIGPTVNKAARIMVAYPGKVTCDRETFLHSRLESGNFILQEAKELKGLHQAGPIYEFREHLMPKKTHILSKFPLLSRDDEMGLYQVLCDEARIRYKPRRYSQTQGNIRRTMMTDRRVSTKSLTPSIKYTTKYPLSPVKKRRNYQGASKDRWRKASRYFVSGLVIKAEPRMGKSRLLDEMLHSSRSPEVKIARIALTPKDFQMTLFGINKILEPILSFPENASYKEKEERLLLILRNVPRQKWQYLYTLNELFQTTIDFTRTHPSERYPDPLKAMKRGLWVLLSQVVKCYWIIGIDDLEFLDTASWQLLPVLLEKDFAFFVMALGNRLDLSPDCEEILSQNRHLYHVTLGGIDKWYQVGLACQILDVWAVPPELERLIHERSGGNPGWVESYLVTQQQQNVLKVTSMTQDEADAMGLVRPPARMITRAAARRARTPVDPTRMHPTEDRWEMFKSCYHESKEKVATQKAGDALVKFWQETAMPEMPVTRNLRLRLLQFMGTADFRKTKGDKVIAVCILTPGSELLGLTDEDFTINSMMLKVFDSLTSFEQMLLKCGAVLGETFLRKMLVALMSDPDTRQLALCVQKLFEMQVLTCASSDLGTSRSTILSGTTASFTGHVESAMTGMVTCQCPALKIDEANRDLPDYASCSYMRFRMPSFRDTVYSLLTDSQKKEYHERAMRYLEQETRRCHACGRRHFLLLLGTRYDRNIGQRFHRYRRRGRRRKSSTSRDSSGSYTASFSQESQSSSRHSLSTHIHSSDERLQTGSMHSFLQQITYEDMLLSKIRQSWGDPDDMPASGAVERSKAKDRYLPTGFPGNILSMFLGKGRVPSAAGLSLTRSFSSFNFTDCECTLILTSVYTQILGHCRGAELDEKTMDALLEYAEVCVYISNHAQAQRLLFEARKLLAEAKTEPQFGLKKVEDTREGSYIPSWKWPYLMGRIHTLLGYSRLEMGQYEEAHFQLHLAMAHMGVPFPENRFVLRMVTSASNFRLVLTTSFMSRAWLGLRSGFAATYSDAIAECLSYMYIVFRDMGDWQSARLAATWGINRSLESGFDFLGVCISFANMLEVLQFYGEFVTCAKLEVGAMEVCRNRASYLEIQELVAVGRLYSIVFHSLMTRGRIESAISVGYKTLRIAAAVHATEQRLDVLPDLICCLISRNRVSEAVTLLNELEFIAEEDVDKTGITWYYALAMDIHLKTGYSVLPYTRCEEFFKREGEALYTGRNPQSAHRFYAALWLWCIRLEDWDGAKLWEDLARPEFTVPDLLSVRQYAITTSMIMQGLCIKMAHLMDIDDTKGIAEIVQRVEKFCKLFNKACSYIRFAETHFRAIKAYFTYLKSNNKRRQRRKALRELRTASEIATRQGNARLAEWCKHNEKMWRGLLAPVKAETWRDCADPDTLVDWHEADKTPPRIMHYTLPLPECLD